MKKLETENSVKGSATVDFEKSEHTEDLSSLPFDKAFELTGHGKFNHAVLLTCGLIHLNVSMESVGIGYVIPAAECDLHLTSAQKGLVNAAAFIGIMSTSFVWGYLGDARGRRGVMLPAILCSALLSAASAFSINVWMLVALRFLTGCLVSASSATVYAYLGELHTTPRRAAAIAWGAVFISFSFMLLPALAWAIIPGTWSVALVGPLALVPWRVFMLSWCVPALLAAAALSMLPESPKFVLTRYGPEKALPVLATMYAYNHGTTPDCFPVKRIVTGDHSDAESQVASAGGCMEAVRSLRLIFSPPLLRCVIIAHISIFAVFMLSSGLYMWVPDILNSLLISAQNSKSVCTIIHDKYRSIANATVSSEDVCNAQVSVSVFPISVGMGAVFAVTYLAIGFFINKIGKKTLYSGIMVVCGAMTAGSGFVPHNVVATVLMVLALCSGCAGSILAAIAVDVFPTSLRAMAMCVMYMVGRSGAAVGSYILGSTLDQHCELAFSLFGAFTAGSTLLMLFWPNPEKIQQALVAKGYTF